MRRCVALASAFVLAFVPAFVTAALIVAPSCVDAQQVAKAEPHVATGIIAGRVFRARDSLPLADALVRIDGTDLSARTDRDGTYRISGVAAGERAVRAARIGYYPTVFPELVATGGTTTTDVRLHELPGWLDAVVIRGEKRDIPPYLIDVYRRGASAFGSFFTREDILRENAYDVTSLFHTIPGVLSNNRGVFFARCQTDLSGAPPKVQVYVDGMKMTPAMGALEAMHQVNIDEVQAVEVYRGVAEIPAEFLDDACAVIAIWRRRY